MYARWWATSGGNYWSQYCKKCNKCTIAHNVMHITDILKGTQMEADLEMDISQIAIWRPLTHSNVWIWVKTLVVRHFSWLSFDGFQVDMLCIFHIMVIYCLLSFGWWFATGLIQWTWCRITGGLVSATGSPQCRGIKCLGNDRPYIGFFTICFSPSASRIDENIYARQDVCFRVGPILWVRTSGHLSKVFLMSVSIAITFPPIPLRAIITYFTSDWISEFSFPAAPSFVLSN